MGHIFGNPSRLRNWKSPPRLILGGDFKGVNEVHSERQQNTKTKADGFEERNVV